MNEVYKVVQTRRKCLGCIATQDIKRKTLILTEEAQIETHNKNPRNKEHAKEMVKANIEIAVGKILGSLGEKKCPWKSKEWSWITTGEFTRPMRPQS